MPRPSPSAASVAALLLVGCATASSETRPPLRCPPLPAPVLAADCVRKGDVLAVAEQILMESEQHAEKLVELERSLARLQEDVARALTRSLRAVPASDAQVAVVGRKVRVRLSDELVFKSASAQITPAGLRALDQVAEVIRQTPSQRIEVAGHTDTRPVTRGWADNWQLSLERARQVALYFMSRGIEGKRLVVTGYADTDPVTSDVSDAALARNRRVELFIEPIGDADKPAVEKPAVEDGPEGLKSAPR